MPRGKSKVAAVRTKEPQVASMCLDAFVDRVADKVARRMGGTQVSDAPVSAPFTSAPPPNKPQPPSTAELAKMNHDRASAILSRLVVLSSRLKNEPENGCATAGSTATPGLNEFLQEEGSMLIDAHNVLTGIGTYLGIEI